ncbi:putative transcription factor HRT family [Rosa chinensis]|uniref:Putative transcription factor HRT family n=1 Tax=Rosa chinensis TaxID=74649 RepID=A0A2P6RK45_ROSCH|nr:putative transcription factor HRT family [Rosa chinensis]
MPLILELEDEESPMVAGQVLTLAVQSPTLKREERKRLQHGPHFSKWKVLVAPGKDGAERYRVQNLPGNESPGVYELGVAVPPSGSGRGIKADQIVPVYVGQADSARTRLQQYGRTGAHLGRSCSGNPSEQICKGPGLIEEMLESGYSIVYRWAPMGTKSEAERTERQLLDTHDYAWNTRINGARRRDDVLQKLKEIPSKLTRFTNIVPRPLPSRQKQVGIRINSSNLVSTEDKFSNYADRESRNLIPQVFKFGRSQPRLVLDGSGITWEDTIICGVAVGDGSICRKAPVQGRKRCAEHKGTRITESITASNADSKSSFIGTRELISYKSGITQENTEICGVVTGNGSTCRRPPVPGRVRCAEHKGMRITGSTTASSADSKSSFIGTRELISYKSGITQENTEICGVVTGNGSTCRRPPVPGRVRCAEHKGMRITGSTTASNVDSRCSFISNREFVSYESGITWENTGICGARTNTGSACRRPPVQGRQRCAVHKGRRI